LDACRSPAIERESGDLSLIVARESESSAELPEFVFSLRDQAYSGKIPAFYEKRGAFKDDPI
jgi:hypothetical protein